MAKPGVRQIDAVQGSGLDVTIEPRMVEILGYDTELASVPKGK